MKKEVYLVIFLLSFNIAVALGVAPAFKNIDFEPGLSSDYEIKIYNTDSKDFTAVLSTEGQLAEYLTLGEQEILMTSQDHMKKVSYTIALPQEMQPGSYSAVIKVQELPEGTHGQSAVAAALSVTHKLTLNVPAAGKYLTIEAEVLGSQLKITLTNIGAEPISTIELLINAMEHDREVANFRDSVKNLQPAMSTTLTEALALDEGAYLFKITADADGETQTLEKALSVGEVELVITGFRVEEFTAEEIAKLPVTVESNWNTKIAGLTAKLTVRKDGQAVGTYASESFDIEPKSSATVDTFWDTKGIALGEYEATVTIDYQGKQATASYVFMLSETALEVSEKRLDLTMPLMIVGGVVAVVLLVILIMLLFKKRGGVEIHYYD